MDIYIVTIALAIAVILLVIRVEMLAKELRAKDSKRYLYFSKEDDAFGMEKIEIVSLVYYILDYLNLQVVGKQVKLEKRKKK